MSYAAKLAMSCTGELGAWLDKEVRPLVDHDPELAVREFQPRGVVF
jgi:hypothetical protein